MRGQAFDVFKLLIAAIIALAIVGVLMPLIWNVMSPVQKPTEAARQLVQQGATAPGDVQISNKVRFKKGEVMSASAVIGNSGLLPEQVCFVPCEEIERAQGVCSPALSEKFEFTESYLTLKPEAPNTVDAKILVYCDYGLCEAGEGLIGCQITVIPPT